MVLDVFCFVFCGTLCRQSFLPDYCDEYAFFPNQPSVHAN